MKRHNQVGKTKVARDKRILIALPYFSYLTRQDRGKHEETDNHMIKIHFQRRFSCEVTGAEAEGNGEWTRYNTERRGGRAVIIFLTLLPVILRSERSSKGWPASLCLVGCLLVTLITLTYPISQINEWLH